MVHSSTCSSVKSIRGFELKDVLTPTDRQPRLWIQRVVLMERPSIDALIRDIPLYRGLNIIVGKSEKNDPGQQSPAVFSHSGHSVGKTTLCRIIRYLLGEQSFGSQKGQDLIRENFPEGWAAAEVIVDGETWAIARPFSARFKARVAKDIPIEELFAPDFLGIGYGEYEQALRQLLPPHADLPSITFDWKHLLAWLARDQESRLRDFWAWRDKSSESKTSFQAPVEHPRHLARATFKMVSSRTEELERSVSELRERLKKAEEELDHQIVAPRLRLEDAKRCLNNFLSGDVRLAEKGGPLFSYEMQAQTEISRLDGMLADKQTKLSDIDGKLARLVPLIHNLKKLIDISSQSVNLEMERIKSIEDPDDDPDEHRLRKLENNIDYKCEYAPNIKIGSCPEAQKELRRLIDSNIIRIDEQKRKKMDKDALKRHVEQLAASKDRRRQDIDYYNESIDLKNSLLRKRTFLINEIDAIIRKRSEIQLHIDEYSRQSGIIDGNIIAEEIDKARQNVDVLSVELSLEENELESERKSSTVHAKQICDVFSVFIKIVLGDNYSGILKTNNDFSFDILENGELSGSVVDTISIILGDITAMICSSQGTSVHPGMLIHDSPRESDLASGLYANIFNLLLKLVTHFYGNDSCPFQYIITTTTPAPEWAAPFARLVLAREPESDLLFKQKIAFQMPPGQLCLVT